MPRRLLRRVGGSDATFFRVFAMVQSTSTRRGFSLSDANATLPLVRSIVADLIELHAAVVAREARIEFLLGKRTDKPRDAYDDELREVQRSLTDDRQQLARYEAEIESLGIRIRTASEGLMEFPSYLGETRSVCFGGQGIKPSLHGLRSMAKSMLTSKVVSSPPVPNPNLPSGAARARFRSRALRGLLQRGDAW